MDLGFPSIRQPIITVRQRSCGKLMFSKASVILSREGGLYSGQRPSEQRHPGQRPRPHLR